MKRNIFVKTLLLIAIIIGTFDLFAQETRSFDFNHKGKGIELTNQTRGNVTIEYSLDHLELTPLLYKGEEMQSVVISGISIPNEKGLPNVPVFSRFVAVPQGAEAVLRIVNYEQTLIEDVNIEPSLGVQAEDQEPDMNYVKDQRIYAENAFYPAEFVSLGEPVSMRGVDMVAVDISPVQYNPVTKQAIVYHNIKLKIEFRGGNGHIGDDQLRSPYWDPILEQNLLNYESLPEIDYEARMQQWLRDGSDGYEYIIVTPNNDAWADAAYELKEFRTRQGVLTEVYRLDEMGVTTTNEMKSWFHDAYKNWTIKPVAVLMFGDHNTDMTQGVPAEMVSHPYQPCVSDNQYADVTGDYLPDMVFSRLVAANGTEANIMASKQIEYETVPNMDPNAYQKPVTALGWQTERWFQICSEVVGGYFRSKGKTPIRVNCIYAGQPGSQWSTAQNTNNVVSYFGPSGTNYIPSTPSELGGWTGGTAAQIRNAIDAGTMLVQHRDHGYEQGWGEPGFSVAHVNQLQNVGKMPFVMSINCLTGKYNHNTTCFAEALMRHTYEGKNAGAVGVLCPTQVSFSFCNDAFVWGVYDHFQPDFMPSYGPYANRSGNWLPAFGNVAGKYFLAQSSWPLNPGSKQITYQMFTAHCDAFLRLFSEVPQEMLVEHQPKMFTGAESFVVSAPAGTTIALSTGEGEDLQLLAVATATGADQALAISATLPPSTIVKVTVTGQNYKRYEYNVEVVANNGPYVLYDSYTINNATHQLEYGDENVEMILSVKNVGVDPSAGVVNATISTESEYVTISTASGATTSVIAANAISNIGGFRLEVDDDIADSTMVRFDLECTSGNESWESHFFVLLHAPQLEVASLTMEDDIMPGESGNISYELVNRGSAAAKNATLTLENTSPKITLPTTSCNIGTIAANSSMHKFIELQADNDIALGTSFDIDHNLTAGNYSDEGTLQAIIGIYSETFETGDFYSYRWAQGTHPWIITADKSYRGTYSAKSSNATIGSSSSELSITINVESTGEISFYHCESSELGCDQLKFYIDGKQKGAWSGTTDWTQFKTTVTAGQHIFKWSYEKDESFNSGWDCAWIDHIKFPPTHVEPAYKPVANLQKTIVGYTVTLTWEKGEDNVENYYVSRDGNAAVNLTEPTFTESFNEPGTHIYSVSETDGVWTSAPVSIEAKINPIETHWKPDFYQHQSNMCLTSIIKIDDVEQQQPTLEIGVFCGDECRGSQIPQYLGNGKDGRYILNLMVYGDGGSKDELTFRIYDHVQAKELDYECINDILAFTADAFNGNPTTPYEICFSTGEPISGELNENHIYTKNCRIVGATTIKSGVVIEFEKELRNATPDNLTIEDGAQLIINNSVGATVQKNIIAADWTPGNADNWHGIGLPISTVNVSSSNIESLVTQGDNNDYDLFRYDEPTHYWMNYKVDETFTTLEAGRGYLYASQAGTTINFKGYLNFENVETSLTSTENNPLVGFNFISNPYTHDIYKGDGTAIDNKNLATGFYKMKKDGTWLACLDKEDAINSGEAILVNASEDCTIEMTNTISSGNTKANDDFIKIIVTSRNHEDAAYALFEDVTPLKKIGHHSPEIQSVFISKDGEKYAIATMDDNTTSFNLGINSPTTTTMTIDINTKGIFEYLHLIDKMTGNDIDMLIEDSYSFVATPNDIDNRFIINLIYKTDSDNNSFAYQVGDEIIVNGFGTMQIFDLLGRVVADRHVNGSETINISALSTGVYVIRMNGEQDKSQKIIIRK